uniref:Uncharacterized protein n=1 Tax=Mycena chlorophos TaxID=658473 RepID=A0ABQ0L3M6_MYCCL|nr:predicted protein [Mycena chlorophos]
MLEHRQRVHRYPSGDIIPRQVCRIPVAFVPLPIPNQHEVALRLFSLFLNASIRSSASLFSSDGLSHALFCTGDKLEGAGYGRAREDARSRGRFSTYLEWICPSQPVLELRMSWAQPPRRLIRGRTLKVRRGFLAWSKRYLGLDAPRDP